MRTVLVEDWLEIPEGGKKSIASKLL